MPLFNPQSSFIEWWKLFLVIPLSYELWGIPFRVAMPSTADKVNPLLISDLLADACFVLNTVIQMNTKVILADPTLTDDISEVASRRDLFFHILHNDVLKHLLPCSGMHIIQLAGGGFWLFALSQFPRFVAPQQE
ncbi:hypothetical protein CYMTET_53502 [Cymbomonas tetramitiformis]|uniref:Uncharacterized protein n=1 Tax=Cymbomonas tetramitiformis TaxID=36881 RepID=A0AAE0BHZ0_9CHLO|nr:hypothetical protein CYMTET_53502 [Cymbomonas tetramitiformis]